MRPPEAGPGHSGPWSPWRLLPLLAIVTALALFFALGLYRYFTLALLREKHAALQELVRDHYAAALLSFVGLYTAAVALSIPVAILLTLAGGLLFGALATTFGVMIGATLGASLLFLAARSSLGDLLRAKSGPWLGRLERGFQRDQWSFMLFLRLTPVIPFFVVNLAPAFLGVSLTCFVITTFFGIAPITAIYALAGAGIGEALNAGTNLTLTGIVTPKVIAALTGLAVLAVLPAIYRRFRPGELPGDTSK